MVTMMTIIITACITHCPRMVPCVRQMLHKWPGRKPVSQFNNRNKMSFIPKKKKEEQKQRNTWVAFGLETESSILAEAQC